MNKYKAYIPIALIIAVFLLIVYFREDMVERISKGRTERLSISTKNAIDNYISTNHDYSQNGKNYEYTFLEFGSTGCLPCRQMESVLEEIRSKYGDKVNVVFVNVMLKENQKLSEYFAIATIPTQVLLDKHGKEFFRHNGFYSTAELIEVMGL